MKKKKKGLVNSIFLPCKNASNGTEKYGHKLQKIHTRSYGACEFKTCTATNLVFILDVGVLHGLFLFGLFIRCSFWFSFFYFKNPLILFFSQHSWYLFRTFTQTWFFFTSGIPVLNLVNFNGTLRWIDLNSIGTLFVRVKRLTQEWLLQTCFASTILTNDQYSSSANTYRPIL